MAAAKLDEPITAGANTFVHFFNGRLLTGEDLSREQDANERARAQLALSVGSGVVTGLEVSAARGATAADPAVTVEGGLAVTRAGRVVELPVRTDVSLVRRPTAPGAAPEVLFHDCKPTQPATYTTGAGVYLLTIAPAPSKQGRAPVSGLGNADAACNTSVSLEGVRFRLARLSLPVSAVAQPSLLRSRVAHLLRGTGDPARAAFAGNPWGVVPLRYGLLDELRAECLDPDEVPLALLRWTRATGIAFVDLWAVRRRVTRLDAEARWPLFLSDRVAADAEALFLQFQAQVDELRASASAPAPAAAAPASPPSPPAPPPPGATVRAADVFQYLPPVGVLPVAGPNSPIGFDTTAFFGAQASRSVAMMDAAQLRSLVWDSLAHDPIAVGSPEKIQLYSVWENVNAVAAGTATQRVVVFAKETLRFRGAARYGAERWGEARAAHVVV